MPPVLHRVRKTLVAEHRLLAGFLVALALAVGFGSLAGEMTEGETGALDKTIELAFRHPHDLATPIGPVFLKTAMIDITALGSETILALV
jgi:undecaprenyl-diphosphatase